MTKKDYRELFCGLLPDGLDVRMLTPTGRAEIRRALDVLLEQAQRDELVARGSDDEKAEEMVRGAS